MPVMRMKNQVLYPWPRRRQSGYVLTDAQLQQKHREAKRYRVYRAAGFSAFYMHYPIMISIRILTLSSIKTLQFFPLSKELPKFILESRWALLSVAMKILFTMLYVSRCDIISGTSHSPHLHENNCSHMCIRGWGSGCRVSWCHTNVVLFYNSLQIIAAIFISVFMSVGPLFWKGRETFVGMFLKHFLMIQASFTHTCQKSF